MTGRVDPRRTLATFEAVTGDLLQAGDDATVARLVRETAADLLGRDSVYVHLFDAETTRLVPAATPPDVSDGTDSLAVGFTDGTLLWETYLAGAPVVRESIDEEVVFGQGEALSSAVMLPIGDHGVLTVATEARTRFADEGMVQLNLLATLASAALERLERERHLAACERERREESTRLERLGDATRMLVGALRAVASATTRTGMERAVCHRLVDADRVGYAWIGELEGAAGSESLTSRVWATDEPGDSNGAPFDPAAGGENGGDVAPARRAADTGETVRVSDVSDGLHSATWRREMLSQGLQSAVSLPLAYREDPYGVLTVCSPRSEGFDDITVDVLEGVASSVAQAIHAHELRRAFYTDSVTEIEIEIDGSNDFFARVARETGCRVAFESVDPAEGAETRRVLFTTTGAPAAAVDAFLANAPSVESYDHLATREDGAVFRVRLGGAFVVSELAAYGAAVQYLAADGATTVVGLELPRTVEVRGFLDRARVAYPGTSIRSRRTRERPIQTLQSFRERFEDRLTDRQLEVLRVAARSGFFEWPREVTAQELAEVLDISQPTFSRHLREAERKFVELVFADGDP